MWNQLVLGLATLSSMTGMNTSINYDISREQIKDICDDIGINDNCILSVNDIYSIDGTNRYLEITLDSNWILVDKATKNIQENLDYNPYGKYNDNLKIYDPNELEFKFGIYNNGDFTDVFDNEAIEYTNFCELNFNYPMSNITLSSANVNMIY